MMALMKDFVVFVLRFGKGIQRPDAGASYKDSPQAFIGADESSPLRNWVITAIGDGRR